MENKLAQILQKNFNNNVSIPAFDNGNGSSGPFFLESDIYMNIDIIDPRECKFEEIDRNLFNKVFDSLLIVENINDWEQWRIQKGSGNNPYTIIFWTYKN